MRRAALRSARWTSILISRPSLFAALDIQTDIPADQVFHLPLGLHQFRPDIAPVQNDPNQELDALTITVKTSVQEIIDNEAKPAREPFNSPLFP